VRVRIKRKPREDELDGVRLDALQPNMVREVSASVGSWLIAEGYAVPEMRRIAEDDGFSTVKDLPDSANDYPRRRSTDRDRRLRDSANRDLRRRSTDRDPRS
jgi:hypothetical protein